jgi:membrane-associated phospholipid phosphatase
MNTADAVSLTLLLTYAIPIALTCYNPKYFVLFIAVIFTWLSVEAIKPFIQSPRPSGATKCDRWCREGPSGGRPGFPSGHMASVAVLVALLAYSFPSLLVLLSAVVWLLAMAWSRLEKQCHTSKQVLGGTVYGFLVAGVLLLAGFLH